MNRRAQHKTKRARGSKPRFSRDLEILFEDNAVIVINKPAGLPSVPIKGSDTPSALSLIAKRLKGRAHVVHRIDRFTSGIILFAKHEREKAVLARHFLAHEPTREYLAVIRGHLRKPQGELVHHFRRQGMYQKLTDENDKHGARAELSYRLESSLRNASVVRVSLVTGLQNQIRTQFSAIGHPVIGDRKYNPEEASERRISRVALHAARLRFRHPTTMKWMEIECEPPHDFQSLIRVLTPKDGRSSLRSKREPR